MGLAIIYIYDNTVTDFTYNGQPLNKAYEVVVDNIINDSFFVTFNHPLDDKGIYKTIEKDKIVKVHTPDGMQPFRIMDRVKYMDHISIEAWPLFYADMRNKLVKPLSIRGLSGQAAVNTFVNNLLIDTPFTFTSNITDTHDYHTQDTEERESNPNQLYNALDVFKDIVKRWQGELVINGYDVRVVNRLGKNTGALLYEKKNISDFTDEESIQDVTTRLYGKSEWTERPQGSDEEVKHEISVKVESPLINAYSGIVFEKQYTNNDIRTEKEMRDWLNLKFTTDNIDKPSRSIKVGTNIVDDTVISMGDSIVLKYVKHDVDMEIRMVGYAYDGYANRYITIQLGDAKQSYVGNVQNTVREIETNVNTAVKQTVNQILNANGERMIYSVNEPVGSFKNGDVWFDQQGGMYFWDEDRGMWIDHPYNRNMNLIADKIANEIEPGLVELDKSIADADTRANTAIEKAGANANLLSTHQNTLNTINNTTIPNISSSISDAMKEARTALSSASSAMDEAKKADGKIADYVTKNGLVNGTTVDSKINTATGEISKKITTVESKIPTEIGGRNLLTGTHAELKPYTKSNWDFNPQRIYSSKLDFYGIKEGTKLTYRVYIDNPSEGAMAHIQFVKKPIAYVQYYGNSIPAGGSGYSTFTIEVSDTDLYQLDFIQIAVRGSATTATTNLAKKKLEIGSVPTDWTPAPEDNYTKSEYLSFYENEYKQTAKGVTDTWTAVNKIIDANGNSTDSFAQAVYDKNAARQSADFKSVTDGLVKTATYEDGINGVKDSITSIQGDIKYLSKDINYFSVAKWESITNKPTSTSVPYMTVDGLKSNTKYTVSTNIPERGDAYYDVFASTDFDITPASSNANGLSSAKPKQVTSNGNGQLDVAIRDHDLSSGEWWVKVEEGEVATPWNPNINDLLGKTDFSIFKSDYERNDKLVQQRLTSIDSSEAGSVVTRLNKTESTASGNSKLITTINNSYVTQKAIDESILTDKQIKDTRNDNQLPSWYMSNYPKQQVREFKLNSVMGVKTDTSGTYGVLTTNVQWGDTSGGTVKQQLVNDDATFTRTGNSNGASWGAWATQVDTSNKTYQKVTETSSLYERVLGSDENGITSKVARIVQTSDVIQTEVAKMDLSETNYVLNSDEYVWTNNYHVKSYDLADEIPRGTKIKISVWGGLSSGVRTFGVWINNSSGLNSSNSQVIDLVQQSGTYGQGQVHPLQKWTAEVTLAVPASSILIFGRDNNTTHAKRIEYVQIETGATFTPWKPSSKGLSSTITQLADNINLKVSKTDLLSQINVQAGGVLIQSGTNKLNITPETTYIQDATIKSAMIASLEADKITTGTLDASKVKVVNIDANNITANKTSFVQSVWNSLESSIRIDGGGLLSTASDKSQVYLRNGVVGARNPSGATIGQIGYAYESSSPWYSMQVSHGSHFQIRMSRGDGQLNKQAFYIISGGTESYLNTDNIYLNPSSSGCVRVQGAMTVDKDLRTEGTILVRQKLEYLNGGFIESQSANSNMLIGASNKLVIYTNGSNALEFDANNAVFRRKISENSDIRLKTNIVDMPIDSLDAIRNLEIKKFDYLDGRKDYYGIIAQQAQQYLPELINTDSEGYLMVDKSAMTYVNMHAIQQLDSKVDNKVEQLEAKIATLEKELATLKGD